MWAYPEQAELPEEFLFKLSHRVDGQTMAKFCEALNLWHLAYSSQWLRLYFRYQMEYIQWLDRTLCEQFLLSPLIPLHKAADIFKYYGEINSFYQCFINNPLPREFVPRFRASFYVCMDKCTRYYASRYKQLKDLLLSPMELVSPTTNELSHLPRTPMMECERILLPTISRRDQVKTQVEWIVKDMISLETSDCIFLIIGGSMLQPAWKEFTLAINTLKDIMKPHQILIIAMTKTGTSSGLWNALWLLNELIEFGVQFPLVNWRIWCIEESKSGFLNWGDIYQWACLQTSMSRLQQYMADK